MTERYSGLPIDCFPMPKKAYGRKVVVVDKPINTDPEHYHVTEILEPVQGQGSAGSGQWWIVDDVHRAIKLLREKGIKAHEWTDEDKYREAAGELGKDEYEVWSGWVGESKLEPLPDFQSGRTISYSLESAKAIIKKRIEKYKKNPWGDKPLRVVAIEVQRKIVYEESSGK